MTDSRGPADTTIRVSEQTRDELQDRKEEPGETYDEVLARMIDMVDAMESVPSVSGDQELEAEAALLEVKRRQSERRAEQLASELHDLRARVQRVQEVLDADLGTNSVSSTSLNESESQPDDETLAAALLGTDRVTTDAQMVTPDDDDDIDRLRIDGWMFDSSE